MKIKTLHIFVSILALASAALFADLVTVQVTGIGTTYRIAVNEALISAVEQQCGLTIDSTIHSQLTSAERTETTTAAGDAVSLTINDSIANDMKKWAKGRITSYRVLSQNYDKETKFFTVSLEVNLPGEYIVGNHNPDRRRMTIAPFKLINETVSIYGTTIYSSEWNNRFNNKLNEHFTQTRKFTMLDRNFEEDIQKELAILSAPNAASGEAIRLNQRLGTDYLIVGTVTLHPIMPPQINPWTKQIVPNTQPTDFAEIHYRVILAPTGQLKWADSIKLTAPQLPPNATLLDVLDITSEMAATNIADSIMNCILPLEVVGKTDDGRVVIGEGGKALLVDDFLNAFAQGKTVTDTRTGEIIGETETCIAVLQVVEVTERLSYARVVQGDPNLLKEGTILRRPKLVPAAEQPAPQVPVAPSTVVPMQNGAVNTPF